MTEDQEHEISKKLAAEIDAKLIEVLTGGTVAQTPKTALMVSGSGYMVVALDDEGNIIKPAKPCPRCGPVWLCLEHMAMVT